MPLRIPVTTTALACASTCTAFAQGLLPGCRRGGRVMRCLCQVFLFLLQGFSLLVVLTSAPAPGDRVYVICALSFLAVFLVLDIGREVAFQVRAPFSDLSICTLPSVIAVNVVSVAQFALLFFLLTLESPTDSRYCAHHLYFLRDIAPLFAAAVYAVWVLHEHVGFTALPRAFCCSVSRISDDADDEERDLWVKHKIKSALGFEAALECFQIIMVVSTAVFTGVVIEIAAARRERCSGVWKVGKVMFPLLVSASGTVAARMTAIRIRDRFCGDSASS